MSVPARISRRKLGRPAVPTDNLSGEDRDAYLALTDLMKSYGLESLAPKILEFIRQGYSGDTVAILLQDTAEYKQRFIGNEARKRAGLPVLSPAEYLATERAYRELMSSAGLPVGFYDSPDDFTKWIEQDVSPTEVKARVDVATELVNSIDPAVKQQFEEWYSTGDMVAYALDRTRATQVLQRQLEATRIGAAGDAQGVQVGRGMAERIAERGFTGEQARAGFGRVAMDTEAATRLGALYGEDYTQADLVQDTFFDDAGAQQKRKRLASRERATFSGSSGQGKTSLSRGDAGSL